MKPERLKESAMLLPAATATGSRVGAATLLVRTELATVLWVLVPYDVPALAPTEHLVQVYTGPGGGGGVYAGTALSAANAAGATKPNATSATLPRNSFFI